MKPIERAKNRGTNLAEIRTPVRVIAMENIAAASASRADLFQVIVFPARVMAGFVRINAIKAGRVKHKVPGKDHDP